MDRQEYLKEFELVYDEDGKIKSLIHPTDKYKMNWIEGAAAWGTVKCPGELSVNIRREFTPRDTLKEIYEFVNQTETDVFIKTGDISIYTTFNDNYQEASVCMTNRCHAHIWCGGEVSYVMALRMGGAAPHLGMVLTEGSLETYSIERNPEKMSNDRGDFLLHPSPFSLAPGEKYTLEWELFWHGGKEDFYRKLLGYKNYLHVSAEKYVIFLGESVHIRVSDGFGGEKRITDIPETTGEREYPIKMNGIHTKCRIMVLPGIDELAGARCRFISGKQQFHKPGSVLDGAYLIYDNEEKCCYYSPRNDYNGGRERVGMGVLIAKYLQSHFDAAIKASLDKYVAFVKRELFDEETGQVFNDVKRNNSYYRLYNHPWMAAFFIELYRLEKKKEHLKNAVKIMLDFYKNGGAHFYAIEVPIHELYSEVMQLGWKEEGEELLGHFRDHAAFIRKCSTNYPSHEVDYEQSIVAPATNIMLQMYIITGEENYLKEAEKHLEILELFNGLQPDHHLYETAIRHWDGYWFGKAVMYGDTFPHYWSALTGNAYLDYAKIKQKPEYYSRAEASIKGTLSMFREDGSASCACLYPWKVNGQKGKFYDVWANDQDWALYYALRSGLCREKEGTQEQEISL
jgi:hypothetical protein